MRRFLRVLLVVILAVLAIKYINSFPKLKTGSTQGNQENQSNINTDTSMLHVAGDKIVNAKDEEIYLRGFQGIQFYPIPTELYFKAVSKNKANANLFDDYAVDLASYRLTDFDITEIKSTGANVVRIWFSLHEIQKEPYQYSEKSLKLLEDTVNKFGEAGIYSILLLGGSGQNDIEESKVYTSQGLTLWDKNDGLWDQSVKLWGVVAKRFEGNAYVAGYDVINEPAAPSRTELHSFYQDVIDTIRKEDKGHIIFLETDLNNKETYQLGGQYKDTNIAASFHFYYPSQFTLPGGTEGMTPDLQYPGTYCHRKTTKCSPVMWNKDQLEKIIVSALTMEDIKGKPLYIGEFGASAIRDDAGAPQWTEDLLSIMNKYKLHYTYHTYIHQSIYGYYWMMKPEVSQSIGKLIQGLANGTVKYEDITDKQKQMLTTQNGYVQRKGIKELLTRYFKDED